MKPTAILFFILYIISFTPTLGQENRHGDVIQITKMRFSERLKQLNRDKLYCSLVNLTWNYKIDFLEPEELKRYFDNDMVLYQKLFNEEELTYYKKQIDNPIEFTPCEIETDSIFIYNKKRDYGTKIINKKFKNVFRSQYTMTVPLFTKDHNYALFSVSTPFGEGRYVYKRENGEWIFRKYFKNLLY